MKSCFADSTFYFKTGKNKLGGLCTAYIDDTLDTEAQQCFDECLGTKKRLCVRKKSEIIVSAPDFKSSQPLAILLYTRSAIIQS